MVAPAGVRRTHGSRSELAGRPVSARVERAHVRRSIGPARRRGGNADPTSSRDAGRHAGGIVGALIALAVSAVVWWNVPKKSETVITNVVRPALTLDRKPLDIQGLLAKVKPSVVSIKTGARTINGVQEAAGSGVVLTKDGFVLTNAHVIEGANTMDAHVR